MIMANFLKTRKSVRDFKNKEVNSEKLEELKKVLEDLVDQEEYKNKIKFKLYENGKYVYDNLKGIGGYSGVMIKSPHYISMDLLDNDEKTIMYGAYYAEELISALNKNGLETCWVSVNQLEDDLRAKVFGDFTNTIDYVLAFGYAKARNPFVQEKFSERLGLEELVYDRVVDQHLDIDELERRGLGDIFFYIRFAPSVRNLQPWRFVLEENKVELYIKFNEGDTPSFIDAGVVMYYFEQLALYLGIKNKWILGEGVREYNGEHYRYIGEYHL